MSQYDEHFEILKWLEQDPDIVPSPKLWEDDPEKMFARIMESLAQKGLTSKDPTSGHSILASVFSWYINRLGYELNLKLAWEWYQYLRMLGTERRPASYPIVELTFTRKRENVAEHSLIPSNTEVRTNSSNPKYKDLKAFTIDDIYFQPGERRKSVRARLNQLGKKEGLPADLLVRIPRVLGPVESVANTKIVYPGRDREPIQETIQRGRDRIRRGDLLVSLEDFRNEALDLGATQVSVLPQRYGVGSNIANTIRIAIYPPSLAPVVRQELTNEERVVGSQIVNVEAAELIPLDGDIEVKFANDLQQQEKINKIATAIATKINPPHAVWGDREFGPRLASALEYTDGIYAVPAVRLKDARNGEPLEKIVEHVKPWQLFVIQKSLRIL